MWGTHFDDNEDWTPVAQYGELLRLLEPGSSRVAAATKTAAPAALTAGLKAGLCPECRRAPGALSEPHRLRTPGVDSYFVGDVRLPTA